QTSQVSLEPDLKNQGTIRNSDVATESYITRFANIKSKTGVRATVDTFLADANSANVASICNQIKNLDVNTADYEAQKTSLKSQLPLYAYCGFNTQNNRGEDFESNGNVIIDIDRIVDEDTLLNYKTLIMKWNVATKGEKLFLLHRTPSFRGLRVVFRGDSKLSMVENQHQFAKEVGLPLEAIDKQVKDIKRISYAVPMDYIFFHHEDLFTGKGAALAASAETQPSTSSEVIINKINNIKRMTKNQSIEINKELIDNYYAKHGYGRMVGNRHNADLEFGKMLKFYKIPTNEVGEYYKYYVSKFAEEGYYQSGDPIETNEGYEAVMWGYAHNTTKTAEITETEYVSTTTETEHSDEKEIKVPYYNCSFKKLEECFSSTSFLVNQIQGIHLPKSVYQSLKPIITDTSKMMVAPAALFATYTTASSYLSDVSYSFKKGARKTLIALNTLVSGNFASGKSTMDDIVEVWAEYLVAQTNLYNAFHKNWKKQEKARQRSLTDDEEPQPEPINPTLYTDGGDMTGAGLKRLLSRCAGKRVCLFVPEVDTIINNMGGKFGITSDVMRKLFDSKDLSTVRAGNAQYRVGENDADDVTKVPGLLNYIFCGTPKAIAKFSPMEDAENGTASRQILCHVEDVLFCEAPDEYPVEDIKAERYIYKVTQELAKMNGHIINTELVALKKEWDQLWTRFGKESHDAAVDKLRRRAQVIAYRIALTNYMIEATENGYTFVKGVWMKDDAEVAAPQLSEDCKKLFIFSANYVMMQQIMRFGTTIRENAKNAVSYDDFSESIERGGNFNLLNKVFTH
ncbi:MAG: DUF3987 domain-containing protein, partial [Clostridia bacterium]|nr:DUF3987 domain-containing protein [Clostridia bacterium]